MLRGATIFDLNACDSDGDFDENLYLIENVTLARIHDCDQILKTATANKFLSQVSEENTGDFHDTKTDK